MRIVERERTRDVGGICGCLLLLYSQSYLNAASCFCFGAVSLEMPDFSTTVIDLIGTRSRSLIGWLSWCSAVSSSVALFATTFADQLTAWARDTMGVTTLVAPREVTSIPIGRCLSCRRNDRSSSSLNCHRVVLLRGSL